MKETIEKRINELKKNLEIEMANLQKLDQVINKTKSKIIAYQGAIGELSKLLESTEIIEKDTEGDDDEEE